MTDKPLLHFSLNRLKYAFRHYNIVSSDFRFDEKTGEVFCFFSGHMVRIIPSYTCKSTEEFFNEVKQFMEEEIILLEGKNNKHFIE